MADGKNGPVTPAEPTPEGLTAGSNDGPGDLPGLDGVDGAGGLDGPDGAGKETSDDVQVDGAGMSGDDLSIEVELEDLDGSGDEARDEALAEVQPDDAGDEALGDGTAGDMHRVPHISVDPMGPALQAPSLPYPVVGIGGSAGSLQAFREILENLDPTTGMAFVLVTHLSPEHESHLSAIMERYTRMPVLAVENGLRPLPNHLYVLLPGQTLRLAGGLFHVETFSDKPRPHLLIDQFFRSMASDQKNHAVGIVLSGADSDGASGLKAIKGEGGIAMVQSPDTAVHPGMPRNSIAADHVDMVIPPADIALQLSRLAYHFTRPEVRSLEEGTPSADDEQSFQRILQLLRSISGLELRQYKPETIRRRMARRMVLLHQASLSAYFRLLQIRPDELRLLQEDLLINVTRFFRDPGFWESLKENVLPVLLKDRSPERPIRIWCAGCSTGEEAYSLAITVIEYLSQNGLEIPVQVFGTDASDQSIEWARLAIYPDSLAVEISPERLRRFFVKVDRGYQVTKRVRDACIFARQNLCNDPPFSHIDILSCRNVMIYFNQTLQRQVMVTFHYALEPGGYMLLGMSEGLREYNDIFTTVDRKFKIYMRTAANLPHSYDVPRSYAIAQTPGLTRSPLLQVESSMWPELELQRAADRIVLARFGPPGLVVDERMNILQSRGQMSPYLELTPGGVSWNLLRVLREDIAAETRGAIQRALRENIPASATAMLENDTGAKEQVQIDVLPISTVVARTRCFLVLFQTADQPGRRGTVEHPALPNLSMDEKDRLVAQLRQDLSSSRFHLQTLVEERDARNQELVSANEEIQSANEELQSTNEELETTKEELQSANEELQTVNEELQQRNLILAQTGNDLNNLLNSVNIPLLMLTSDLRVRQFTPPMQRLLSVRPSDIGRSIREIRLQLSISDLEPILNDVLETLGTRELEVQDGEGRWFLLRVRPYRTAENKIEGLVVVLLDIDQLRSSQQYLLDARDFASTVVECVPVPIVVINTDLSIRTTNTALRELTELSTKELEGRSLPDLVQVLWGIEDLRYRLGELVEAPAGASFEREYESMTPNPKTLLIKAQALSTDGDRVFLLMLQDISTRRERERQISQQKAALETEMETVANTLTRTQEELRGLTAHLFTAHEEEREHIARELHDDVSQRLSLTEMLLTEIQGENCIEDDARKLTSAKTQLQALNADVRQMSHRLHPAILKDLGLPAALKSLVEDFGQREGMPATFLTQDLPESWTDAAATAIYRITQEALRNVAKHAGKTHVKVILEGGEGYLELRVMDLGIGFDQDSDVGPGGLGLISMQERARLAGGTLQVRSALGAGTTVTVRVPVG